jgi:cytochrome c biogenesis protein CcmG/thiol:disulfide interchange protein DsbE
MMDEFVESAMDTEGKTTGRHSRKSRNLLMLVLVTGIASLIFVVSQLPAGLLGGNVAPHLIGRAAPDFTLIPWNIQIQKKQIRLSALHGQVVVVNFWVSWCEPCREEARELEALWRHTQSQGIMVLGVAVQDTPQNGIVFLQRYAISYPSGPDNTGSIARDYHVTNVGIPQTMLINRQGIIVQTFVGATSRDTLERALRNILK